jgi:hypothetical protein
VIDPRRRSADDGVMRILSWLIPAARRTPAHDRAARTGTDDSPSNWMLSSLELAEGLELAEVSGPLPAFPDTMPAFQIPRA